MSIYYQYLFNLISHKGLEIHYSIPTQLHIWVLIGESFWLREHVRILTTELMIGDIELCTNLRPDHFPNKWRGRRLCMKTTGEGSYVGYLRLPKWVCGSPVRSVDRSFKEWCTFVLSFEKQVGVSRSMPCSLRWIDLIRSNPIQSNPSFKNAHWISRNTYDTHNNLEVQMLCSLPWIIQEESDDQCAMFDQQHTSSSCYWITQF